MNLGNCPRCGKLYALNFKDMCSDCIKDIEAEYQRCADFLRETRGATIQEVSEAVDVTIRQITKFIREGRISIKDAPNLSYPCEVCGHLIRESNICESCRTRLTKELRGASADGMEHVSQQNQKNQATYKAIDKLRKY
ncbi:Flagellar operon protein YvyF [Paenibacillus algicola]|uniref:Flagellar operon protein YvyF n=1 Tax=Paenibacillus algicola TaxID=2565926 RepID=A0A4V1G4G1_9BACL|nr:TIGR03826 family flagellar region protein [Paenibacillus algicola]QCT04574.1 Flagellar operon protein YvyF [Paenibacillus algicola]